MLKYGHPLLTLVRSAGGIRVVDRRVGIVNHRRVDLECVDVHRTADRGGVRGASDHDLDGVCVPSLSPDTLKSVCWRSYEDA